jgi:hypothetical protein
MTSRPTHRRAPRLLVSVLAVASLVAACSSSDSSKVSADEWVTDICTSLSGWLEQLQQESTSLQESVQADATGDLAAAKADLVEFMNGAVQSTDEMITEIDAAGVPDVDNGEELNDGLNDGLEDIRQAFADAQGQAEALPVNDQAAFAQGATELGESLQEAGTQAEEQLNDLGAKYDAPSLDQAFDDEPACQDLNT